MDSIKDKKVQLSFLVLEIILFSIAFLSGYLVHTWISSKEDPFPIFTQAFHILQKNGIKEFPVMQKLEYGMIRGLLQVYDDPYTVFVEPPQNELQSNVLEGKFGGIGARLEKNSESILLLYPFPDSPAAQAGVQNGDHLIKIDNLDIFPETIMDDIQAAIRGPVDNIVTLVITRPPDTTPISIQIKRKEFGIPSTTWNLASEDSRVGVIHVSIIAATTPSEVENAVIDLKKQGAVYFILDMRDNYGGLVDAGVNTANLFLKEGVVIEEQYKDKPVKQYKVEKTGPFSDLPLVVLVNHNTASSAEIISGGLQGLKRAQLVGTPTYGKDTIQLLFNLQDGSSIHVTAAHWWIPGFEQSLAGKGLNPDILLPDEASDADYLLAAIHSFSINLR